MRRVDRHRWRNPFYVGVSDGDGVGVTESVDVGVTVGKEPMTEIFAYRREKVQFSEYFPIHCRL